MRSQCDLFLSGYFLDGFICWLYVGNFYIVGNGNKSYLDLYNFHLNLYRLITDNDFEIKTIIIIITIIN